MRVLPSWTLGDRKRPLLIAAAALAALALILARARGHPHHGAPHTSIIAATHPQAAMPTHAAASRTATAAKGIAAHLAAGQRAFSLRVTQDEIVGGFLQSGDHVDILAMLARHPRKAQFRIVLVSGWNERVLRMAASLCHAHALTLLGTLNKPISVRALCDLLEGDSDSRD